MSHRRRAIVLAVLALATTPAPAIAQMPSPDPAPSPPAPDPAPARPSTKDRKPVRPVSDAPRTDEAGTGGVDRPGRIRSRDGAGSGSGSSAASRVTAGTSGSDAGTPRRDAGATASDATRHDAAARSASGDSAGRCAERGGGPPPCRVVSGTSRRAATSRLLAVGAAPAAGTPDEPRTRDAIAGALLLAVALAGCLTLRHARRTA